MRRSFLKAFGLGGFASMLPVAAAGEKKQPGYTPWDDCPDGPECAMCRAQRAHAIATTPPQLPLYSGKPTVWVEVRFDIHEMTEENIIRAMYEFRARTGKRPEIAILDHWGYQSFMDLMKPERKLRNKWSGYAMASNYNWPEYHTPAGSMQVRWSPELLDNMVLLRAQGRMPPAQNVTSKAT